MKRLLAVLLAVMLTLGVLPMAMAEEAAAEPTKRVILDTDMGYLNDDAIVLFMLAQADSMGMCDFLGVTTVGGNSWVASGTTAALRQLELIGREDIPVYMGTDVPIMGFRNMAAERELWGAPEYSGAYWDFSTGDFFDVSQRPTNYLDLPSEPTYGYPETARRMGTPSISSSSRCTSIRRSDHLRHWRGHEHGPGRAQGPHHR